MQKKVLFVLPGIILSALIFVGGSAHALHNRPWHRTIDPIVSTEWLAANLDNENLVILNVRTVFEYDFDHIPGSIHAPFMTFSGNPPAPTFTSGWIVMRDGLLLEVPEESAILEYIGDLGITSAKKVVIVTSPDPLPNPPQYGLASATRVAFTLEFAGFKNYAILDGGYPKWEAEGRQTEKDNTAPTGVVYEGTVNRGMIASLNYVRWNLWKADLVDARDADVYFGVTIEPFAQEAGHIPGASSLPAPWIWNLNDDGTYTFKDAETLGDMAAGVIREPRRYWDRWSPPVIVYCGVGGYASSWWFVLTQVLGYPNVKLYDGSAQEWVMEGYEMVPYKWE